VSERIKNGARLTEGKKRGCAAWMVEWAAARHWAGGAIGVGRWATRRNKKGEGSWAAHAGSGVGRKGVERRSGPSGRNQMGRVLVCLFFSFFFYSKAI